jgi:rare lipoprotein A
MKFIGKTTALVCAFLLASCGSVDGKRDGQRIGGLPPAPEQDSVPDTPVKTGAPYTVGGKTYAPEDVASYDEVGYASWYGDELEGRPTANGETFVAAGISGAHKTLPMPSYVEVTALDTGKTIIVRLNDRGPFANDRLIDLSAGAARELGIMGQGVSGVRVRKINPSEQDKSVLRAGRSAPPKMDTPESLLKVLRGKLAGMPKPAAGAAPVRQAAVAQPPYAAPESAPAHGNGRFVREGAGTAPQQHHQPAVQATRPTPAPAVRNGRFIREGADAPARQASGEVYVVQIAAYSSRARAEDMAKRAGARIQASSDGKMFRVRFGPYATLAEAEQALAGARARGHNGARVFTE